MRYSRYWEVIFLCVLLIMGCQDDFRDGDDDDTDSILTGDPSDATGDEPHTGSDSDSTIDGDRDSGMETETDPSSDLVDDSDTTGHAVDTEDDIDDDMNDPEDTDSGIGLSFNICNEEVPENRYVGGIPAYAQCDASETGSIWSNDGIHTSIEQVDSTWVRTQRSGGYQCTEFARRYLYFVWDVANVPTGNAGTWCNGDPPAGLEKTMSPVHGDVIVFAPGSCGASLEYGHVAVVDTVNESNATVTFVEQNRANRRTCAISTAECFLHALSNSN